MDIPIFETWLQLNRLLCAVIQVSLFLNISHFHCKLFDLRYLMIG